MTIDETILKEAISKWGVDAQIKMLREECLELAVEISKFYDRDNTEERFNKLIDEIADVTIMSKQMEFVPSLKEKIQERVDFKMNRLKDRLTKSIF